MTTEARTPHEWQDQQLVSRHTDNADESQGYNTAALSLSDHEEDLIPFAHNYEPIASQDQYRHHGSSSNLEPSEAGFDPAPSEQATRPDTFTQKVHSLKTFLPDQICTCAVCLDVSYTKDRPKFDKIQWIDEHPQLKSWTFGCRVAGCQWTTKDSPRKIFYNAYDAFLHDVDRSHYGKQGNWRCREANCKFITKRWNDFKRHTSSKHCIKPKKLKCPDLSCKYHQDGFARKDKLDSHYQKVHGGKSQPGKPNQAIKPKIGDCA